MKFLGKIKNLLRRIFTPRAYAKDHLREQLLGGLTPEQQMLLADLKKASGEYQKTYDSRSGFGHLVDTSDIYITTVRVATQRQICQDECLPQMLVDDCTHPVILRLLRELEHTRVLPVGQGMAS